ncbi:hypothetical protein D4764_18G0011440 [Takifugu flavidus]|uniref:Uncharacterized protein n=1 Tax=Takifugu flavidus TaxID=433684 RepID=A0A5C6NU44_9TELE|nr:hypothetical protein D4764_18G0011440 [Takifugu flavidus]
MGSSGCDNRRTKSEIRGRESVGESKCPEARGNPSEEGEEEEVRGRGARKVAEEQGETLENAGSRWKTQGDREALGVAGRHKGAGGRQGSLGSRWGAWRDAGRTKSEIRGREPMGESKCPEARGNPSEEGEEVRGRGARKVAEEQGETLENAGSRRKTQGDTERAPGIAGEPGEMLGRRNVLPKHPLDQALA